MISLEEFWLEGKANSSGDTLDSIMERLDNRDLKWIEKTHDFIQWIFPTFEKSSYQPDIPVLTPELLQKNRKLRIKIAWLDWQLDGMEDFYQNTKKWLLEKDHNHFRITRILKSCRTVQHYAADCMGCSMKDSYVDKFYSSIMAQAHCFGAINPETLKIWSNAYLEIT